MLDRLLVHVLLPLIGSEIRTRALVCVGVGWVEEGGGCMGKNDKGGELVNSRVNLARILYKWGLAAYAAPAWLALAAHSGHSLVHVVYLPLQLQQKWVEGVLAVGQLLDSCPLAQKLQVFLLLHVRAGCP